MAGTDTPSEALQGATLRRALLERLRFERAMGLETIRPVDLPRKTAPVAAATTPATVPIATASATATRVRETSSANEPAAPIKPAPPTVRASASETTTATTAAPTAAPIPAGDKAARWKDLETRALACVQCVLHTGRTNVVFGCGNREARLLFVGEGPGESEDLQGIPFVGRAGELLNKIISAMACTRDDVYICNVVKCRPPQNRTPLPDEIAACSPYLFEQIALVAPKVIVTLGAPATKTLLRTTQGIMSLRGRWSNFRGTPVMPTYHPAFVLRQYTEEVRRAVWEDMKKVMERLKEAH